MAQKRICECCGAEYYPTSSAQKYCTSCRMLELHIKLAREIKRQQKKESQKQKNNGKATESES